MDFWDLTKLVFRRWYIAVPLLIITGLAAAYTAYTVKPDYKATAYVQLIPPPEASITTNIKELRNPWLDLGLGALNTAATYSTVDRKFLDQLKTGGMSDNVVITNGYPAPIATIEVIGSSKQAAMGTTDQVVARFNAVIKSLQDDYAVKDKGLILTRRLDTGNNLEETGGKVKRALVAVAGAGALLTAGLTVAFDAMMRRRQARLDAKKAAADAAGPPPEEKPEPVESAAGKGTAKVPEDKISEGTGRSPGGETVKISVAVPYVNGKARVNGTRVKAAAAVEEPKSVGEATSVIRPSTVYKSSGEGGSSES